MDKPVVLDRVQNWHVVAVAASIVASKIGAARNDMVGFQYDITSEHKRTENSCDKVKWSKQVSD